MPLLMVLTSTSCEDYTYQFTGLLYVGDYNGMGLQLSWQMAEDTVTNMPGSGKASFILAATLNGAATCQKDWTPIYCIVGVLLLAV